MFSRLVLFWVWKRPALHRNKWCLLVSASLRHRITSVVAQTGHWRDLGKKLFFIVWSPNTHVISVIVNAFCAPDSLRRHVAIWRSQD